ncbi:hypothetical protein JZ751_020116 [Albula glossodonta]|uniref:Uncharacterized protein n=1 Tax=Albula glossodonta TaxID=121402 RepID=A0A8T2NJN7_9TELE|nr:hypothetical protein JZ751_020116 [Albula glossodonta]
MGSLDVDVAYINGSHTEVGWAVGKVLEAMASFSTLCQYMEVEHCPGETALCHTSDFAGLSDVSISADIPVEGEITVPVSSPSQDDEYSTLDEPVKDTIVRDTLILSAVGSALSFVSP